MTTESEVERKNRRWSDGYISRARIQPDRFNHAHAYADRIKVPTILIVGGTARAISHKKGMRNKFQ